MALLRTYSQRASKRGIENTSIDHVQESKESYVQCEEFYRAQSE